MSDLERIEAAMEEKVRPALRAHGGDISIDHVAGKTVYVKLLGQCAGCAGALGWFIAWPLAVTAGVGAYKQKKLPEEIFQVIEQCIVSGGRSVVVRNAGAELNAGMVVCPACKTQCAAGAKFCNNCGAKLENKCPQCGAEIPPGSRFCGACGTPLSPQGAPVR